ncbi:putative metal-binding motif-containing protein [Candidatus Woesearchaeota archaeon]|nr:putative metal-binding motif-containing protein [Candidatus Woesearchaeota archaeon]
MCDGKDNNCNIVIDELFDRDNDKYTTCGTKTDGTDILVDTVIDCNDNDNKVNPGAAELCDGKDNNCNRESDERGVCGYDIARRTDFRFGNALIGIDSCIGDPDMDLLSSYIRSPALSISSPSWSDSFGKYDFTGDGIKIIMILLLAIGTARTMINLLILELQNCVMERIIIAML